MNSKTLVLALVALGALKANAQQKSLSVKEAVALALQNSNETQWAATKVATKGYDLQVTRNNLYPDFKLTGQYLRLTNANVRLPASQDSGTDPANGNSGSSPQVNSLAFGQAAFNLPVFAGGRLRHSIEAADNVYKSEQANAAQTKEEVAIQVIEYYAALYKAQRSVELLRESLESNAQRVKDFTAREQNGLIARNDLLKVQLQKSQVQLSLDEAEKNVRVINYELVQLLKLPAATQIIVDPSNVDPNLFATPIAPENDALTKRHDLEALSFAEKAADAHVKVAKSAFFPSLSLTGGYVALDLQNVATVTNAMNVGVGVSYNLSSIFKSGKDVKAAKSRAEELREQKEILSDRIKTGIVTAQEDYNLSIKQDEVYNEAVAQAAENYRIVRDKYDNGLSDTTELLDADVAELSAKINLAYARANRVLKFYELLEATGSLTESFNIKP